jgi:hypothetical protein
MKLTGTGHGQQTQVAKEPPLSMCISNVDHSGACCSTLEAHLIVHMLRGQIWDALL